MNNRRWGTTGHPGSAHRVTSRPAPRAPCTHNRGDMGPCTMGSLYKGIINKCNNYKGLGMDCAFTKPPWARPFGPAAAVTASHRGRQLVAPATIGALRAFRTPLLLLGQPGLATAARVT